MNESNDKGSFRSKSELEQTISAGIHGAPEIKKAEKDQYLGEFRERVIRALTINQIEEEGVYSEILEAIKDSRAKKLVISRKVNLDYARDYILLAEEKGLSFTTIDNPDFRGSIGLVVVSDEAVDMEDIYVVSREQQLADKGVPKKLIDAKGEAICKDCKEILKEKAPKELKKYHELSLLDKLLGKKCRACNL